MTIPARVFTLAALVLMAALINVSPASATLVLSSVSFFPEGPLVPGEHQQLTAEYVIIPAGEDTFARGHDLQLQTNLTNARWILQVVVDGRSAAGQEASGNAAFINGEILSYPTERDVSLIVTVDGGVPADATGSVKVLALEELNNTGDIVPGSVLTLNQPVAGRPSTVPTLPPTTVSTLPPTTSSPKATPGFTLPVTLCALGGEHSWYAAMISAGRSEQGHHFLISRSDRRNPGIIAQPSSSATVHP